jgi:hypothetical protein
MLESVHRANGAVAGVMLLLLLLLLRAVSRTAC